MTPIKQRRDFGIAEIDVTQSRDSDALSLLKDIFFFLEAYSVAGEMGFGWWLVEHYLPYHVNRPNGCDSGEPTRGR